jgi:hypothetical protein
MRHRIQRANYDHSTACEKFQILERHRKVRACSPDRTFWNEQFRENQSDADSVDAQADG